MMKEEPLNNLNLLENETAQSQPKKSEELN